MFNKIKNKRIVILGSSSFIGKAIAAKFNDVKKNLILISRKQIDFEKKNSISKLKKILKKNDIVIFVAAIAPVKNIEMLNKNLIIAENIIKSLETIKLSHLIYISSDAVYSDSKKKINENSETTPTSLHGFMHLIRENLLKNLDCIKTFIRPTLVYGNNDPHNGYGPNKFARCAQAKKKIIIFGKGEEKRDHIYVEDVANIVFLSILRKIPGVINAVSGKLISFLEIAKILCKIYPQIKIKSKKRNGPIPHNGYRAFDNKLLKKKFPSLYLTNLQDWLLQKKIYKKL